MDKAILQARNQHDWNDRRKSDRVGLVVRVTYQTVDEIFSEFARNINEGGIFIETDTPQALGSPVELQFKLPGSEELIEVVGTVVRIAEGDEAAETSGMGIEFGELPPNDRQRINSVVRQLRTNG